MTLKVLALSEHFLPRVAGTVHYVCETVKALGDIGIAVHLVVPGPKPSGVTTNDLPCKVTWLDAGYPATGDPTRKSRYAFCHQANAFARDAVTRGECDLVHVLFGLFLMERLETSMLRRAGAPCVATVHNVPPMECARSWPGDTTINRVKDRLRLKAVAAVNALRLRKHSYDRYVVPSDPVKHALAQLRPNAEIDVIHHGVSEDRIRHIRSFKRMGRKTGKSLSLLTLGGWVPHKRQHIIPHIVETLRRNDLPVRWTLAGPENRLPRYKDAIDRDIRARGLSSEIITHGAVSDTQLAELYAAADIYVQPSTEEGFCLTALDAAAAGLPVVGSPAGAIPTLSELSGGRIAESEPRALVDAILAVARSNAGQRWSEERSQAVNQQFQWANAATALKQTYRTAHGAKTVASNGTFPWEAETCRSASAH